MSFKKPLIIILFSCLLFTKYGMKPDYFEKLLIFCMKMMYIGCGKKK